MREGVPRGAPPGAAARALQLGRAPRARARARSRSCPPFVSEFLASLLEAAPEVAIKETRLHHKLAEVAQLDPHAVLVHLVRDPRAVTASMLLGRRRRTDIYPDADTFFTARTGRRLWSSRQISEAAGASLRSLDLPDDIPDFLRPLIVWKAAFQTTDGDGRRLFGDRYVLVRLEDLRAEPATRARRASTRRPGGRRRRRSPAGPRRTSAATPSVHLADDPRWARAVALLEMQPELEHAGYGDIVALEPDPANPST